MRQFLKFMLASMIGTLLIGFVLIVIFIGMLAAMGASFASQGQSTKVEDGSVLHLTLDDEIVDRGDKDKFNLDFGPFQAEGRTGLNNILASLEHAKSDDHIEGIFLDLSSVSTGFATLREIRQKLMEFKKESGKPVVAYAEFYTQGAYYLATAADAVYLQPKGELDYRGLRSEYMFFKGLFEKLDIDVQFIRGSNNKFKSFGEVYTEDHMSEANREQVRLIMDGLWSEHLAAVSEQRKIAPARLNEIADSLLVNNADAAARLGLIDGVKFRDEVLDILKERMSLDAKKKIEFVELGHYVRSFDANGGDDEKKKNEQGKLAIIYAQGGIGSGESEDGSIGSTTISEAIREAREDSTVKAIVFRVNSPGGSGLASDVIWREVKLATAVKPVVVSMGDVAASGGYYISAPATKIYAEPTTITGSIGVFGIIPNMQGFFKNKLGITFDGTKTHHYADMLTVSRPLTADEKAIIQRYVDEFYNGFKERVADGRHMTTAQVDSIGQGRVWTGTDAKARGLVDEIGGLEDAVKAAATLANLEHYETVEMPHQKSVLEQILGDLKGEARMWVASEYLGEDVQLLNQYRRAIEVKKQMGIQARMPFDLIVE
ncbi:MAG TPA: signal peptide peptidase SppA [Flavobacteriales bacterium]|nr:signal peptide peptidase SppA [Flavobacteriales bacterium]